MPDDPGGEEFSSLTNPFRVELLAHCYRMLGSVHDAEDLVQETYLRAWRSYDGFEGRSSLRTWLYRIATRVCLTALENRGRRPLPTGLGGPTTDLDDAATMPDVPWLEPIPDALVGAEGSDPAAIVTSRESIRLAFVAALQHLPPRQRAVLLLRDVLKWRTAEVAEMLHTTTTAVDSTLRRARSHLERVSPRQDALAEPTSAAQRELLDRYVTAFEGRDVVALTELFTDEVSWEMPPFAAWFQGSETVSRHLATQCAAQPGDLRLVRTYANGQPAFATYLRSEDGIHHLTSLQVLTLTTAGIAHVTNFVDPRLFALFSLPDIGRLAHHGGSSA